MSGKIKKLLIGDPLSSEQLHGEKFSELWGLPILSSDAISSVAYAGGEILFVLIPVLGLLAYKSLFYVTMAIVALLLILVFSYRQTIDNYPKGGGSYIVSKDNLGTKPSLVAAASLCIDYTLTVAVSTCAGVDALNSLFPSLLPHKVTVTLVVILILILGNLRGMKESSKIFGLPTYLFIFSILAMIGTGIFKVYVLGITPTPVYPVPLTATGSLGILLFLKAFSAGCTALTGVEAVSDGIPNFKEPAQKRAKNVLALLAILVLTIFGGLSFLSIMYKAMPGQDLTVISQIAIQVFGNHSFMFAMISITTALILTLAANTAFADLPLLLSIIARDGFAPRQFVKRGDRLSFSNGILLLGIAAGILVVIFNGDVHLLLPLYAIGVFISFTLSQYGMFTKWRKEKQPGWKHKAAINGTGAFITACTVIIIGAEKFEGGAWIIGLLIPIIAFTMMRIKRHYTKAADQLRFEVGESPKKHAGNSNIVLVPIDTFNRSFVKCFNYAQKIGGDLELFHVALDRESTEKLVNKLIDNHISAPIVMRRCPYRNLSKTLIEYVDERASQLVPGDSITIVLPQFIVRKWWHQILHNQTSLFLRTSLLSRRNVAIVTIPYIIEE